MEIGFSELALDFPSVDGDPGFSLRVPPLKFCSGEIVFVMGHNGSGKSVFLSLLAGEVKGRRRNSGEEFSPKETVAFVRQKAELSLATDLTVRENLLLRIEAPSVITAIFPARALSRQIDSLVSNHSELIRKLDQPCGRLSVGQRQTLAFVAVTALKSKLLLLDEFLAATDHSTSELLLRMASRYALDNPASVIIVSHDIELALRAAGRIIIFRLGQVIRDLRPDSVEWDAHALVKLVSVRE